MTSENENKSLLEQYKELSRNSLVRVQYSCCGNSTDVDEPEYIPIVPENLVLSANIIYKFASEEDVESILKLLKTNNLPVSDLSSGHRIFLVAAAESEVIGCVAVEIYGKNGLLRSLVVDSNFREKAIGGKLVAEAEKWAADNGIKSLYLLTTTASGFFTKIDGWEETDRATVPNEVAQSTEFASICPSSATCMLKDLH